MTCRGLTASEIESLDFSRLDLSEVYDQQVQNIESKLQQKLDRVNNSKGKNPGFKKTIT